MAKYILLFLPAFFLLACAKKPKTNPALSSSQAFVLPADSVVEIFKSRPIPPWAPKVYSYKESAERKWDLIHTRLEVSFDWEKQQLNGKADLKIEPLFYAQDSLILDARGFDIVFVNGKFGKNTILVSYKYDGLKLRIGFGGKTFSKAQVLDLSIGYVAKPSDLPRGGSEAITDDKGLYFINPNEESADLPRQIWTQGETRGSSCWFPTIDEPNEKCTQEMHITVEDKFKTLSNGLLTSSKKDGKGLRTDVWEMKLPHSPYLFMMAVGDFAVVSDKLEKLPLHYWVEPKYEPVARKIFGRTPAMIAHFSKLLDYPFPWPKYDQVVVRNFVSGAMENTSASVFMESLQGSRKELVDHDWDGIIAHELFHQWFGDLVTLESWANLPLNESFANYSEYLWDEKRLGVDDADYGGLREKQQYFYESSRKREPIIRYNHDKPDDMFDSHSYAKGGRILHMLRKELGDEAFFSALQLYLKKHAFKTVEVHDLRLAFEEVSGRDLNWFFNQWFLSAGHPELALQSKFKGNELVISVNQTQDTSYFPIYRIDFPVEIWVNGKSRREVLKLRNLEDTFGFKMDAQPELILWDADASVLANLDFDRMPKEWIAQYRLSKRGIHRAEALGQLRNSFVDKTMIKTILKEVLNDNFWLCREYALEAIQEMDSIFRMENLKAIIKMANSDPRPEVRVAALKILTELKFDGKQGILEKATLDSSLAVSSLAYKQYLLEEYPDSREKMKFLSEDKDNSYDAVLSAYYESRPGKQSFDWFVSILNKPADAEIYELVRSFGRFLESEKDPTRQEAGFKFLFNLGMEGTRAEQVIAVYQVIKSLKQMPDSAEKRKAIREKHRDDEFFEVLEYLD